MKRSSFFALLAALALLLSACGGTAAPEPAVTGTVAPDSQAQASSEASAHIPSDLFSNRDLENEYDEEDSIPIRLDGDSASCDSAAVDIDGTTVTITDEGVYLLTGTLNDGRIVVDAEKTHKVQLVLSNVSVTCSDFAALYVLQADKVFLTTAEGTENTLAGGDTFESIDENNVDGVIFSKDDLTLNGLGTLKVTAPAGHGIVSKDELTVTGGTYVITAASHGLSGKDSVAVTGADITVAAGKDGIHAENSDDGGLGFLCIASGTIDITAGGDGISASSALSIDGGQFTLVTGGGSGNGEDHGENNWGGMGGGPGGMGGGPGGMGPGGMGPGGPGGGRSGDSTGGASGEDTGDSTSAKGIKAGTDLTLNGGTFTMDCADDAFHANGDLTVTGGSCTLSTGDDGFHADGTLAVTGGTIRILTGYEGLEGLCVDISGGDIGMTVSDDGINAAGGTDGSGFGGRGGDAFGGMGGGSSDCHITVSGGTIDIHASGDGIDSNGTFTVTGGHITVCGPTQGDTAVLDYESTGIITGGTFIGTGSYMMAQTFSDSEQGVYAVSVGNQKAGTEVTLTDGSGNTLFSFAPESDFAIVILSSPQLVKGEPYTITVGADSGTFEAG